jgi:hypothetical protein
MARSLPLSHRREGEYQATKRIIDAAKKGERDPVRLRNAGLAALGFDKEDGAV